MSESEIATVGRYITYCLLPDMYQFPDKLGPAIVLTPTGTEILDQIARVHPGFREADLKAAALGRFTARSSLLIDIDRSDTKSLIEVISAEILHRRIRYPWIVGQSLDQTYAALSRTSSIEDSLSLSPKQSYSLLDSSPQGVFQMRKLVCGPFGLQRSSSSRYFRPLTCGPTYLCDRAECAIGHHVTLKTGNTDSGQSYDAISRLYPANRELSRLVTDIVQPDNDFYDPYNADSLPWLIGNGLTPVEQQTLLHRLILHDDSSLSERLQGNHGGVPSKKGHALNAAKNFDPASCLQLTLLYGTSEIVEKIEQLVDEEAISLTPTELRKPVAVRHAAGGAFRVSLELSRNGVRFLAQPRSLSLRPFLRTIYSTPEQQEELGYLLRDYSGSPYDKLDYFLREADENELLARLVLSSRGALIRAFKELRYGRFEVPLNLLDEQKLRGRLLWKLGRTQEPPASSDQAVMVNVERVQRLESTDYPTPTDWTTIARSVGLDLFVETESFLAVCIEFSCWLLTGDHYTKQEERFVYSKSKARIWSAHLLSSETDGEFVYDESGKNSLGVLIESLLRVVEIADRTMSRAEQFIKQSGAPTYQKYTQATTYPFAHSRLICDLTPISVGDITNSLRSAHLSLTRGKVAEVRNKLGHPPDTFPTLAELRDAAEGVAKAASILAEAGLTPTVFGFESSKRDASGRTATTYLDGRRREARLYRPSPLSKTDIPETADQMIICHSAILNETTEPMRFLMEEDTAFATYWRGYRDRKTSDPSAHSGDVRAE